MDIKKENFKRIAENRVNKILTLYKQLENLTNASFYDYTNEQIEAIFSTLEYELNQTKHKLMKNKSKDTRKKFEL